MAFVNNRSVWQAAGIGPGGGGLQKLQIEYEIKHDKQGKILQSESFTVLFNPTEIAYAKSVEWASKPVADKGWAAKAMRQDFKSSKPETLTITLFFDTYEPAVPSTRWSALIGATNPITSRPQATDVKVHTDKVANLARISEGLHRPPRCILWWGKFRLFVGVLTSLNQSFTMFMADGTPVRAQLACTFTEFNTLIRNVRTRELQSSDVTKRVTVQRTDTLQSIAAAEYNDASLWRHIAKANGIINPLSVTPGMVLIVPPLRQ